MCMYSKVNLDIQITYYLLVDIFNNDFLFFQKLKNIIFHLRM